MIRSLALIAVLVLLAGCGRSDISATLQEERDHLEKQAQNSNTEPAQTRSAITSQAVWGGGVLFAGGALAAIASSVIPIVPRAAAWTAMALGGGAWGLALLVSYTGYLDAWARWVVPVAFLAAVAGLAWVARDWWANRRMARRGEELAWNEGHIDAGVALQAEAKRMTKAQRKAERDRVVAAHERMDAMGASS